uniref:Immunoglobulin V-set domain-containing protein n=1 Tax=Monodelphis domestica TaxID=13616 RepID=F6XL36_MONDO
MVLLHGGGWVWKEFMFTASLLAWWTVQQAWAGLLIEKIPETPQEGQDVLLTVHGVPAAIKDFNWYQGEEVDGSTMIFSYFPGLPRPQRNGNALQGRNIIGFPNGSFLLRHVQLTDSGIYQVGITFNPSWIMRAKTELKVIENDRAQASPVHKHQSGKHSSSAVNSGTLVAIVLGCVGLGALIVGGGLAYLMVSRGWRIRSPGNITVKPEPGRDGCQKHRADGSNIYEVIHSPGILIAPTSVTGIINPNLTPDSPQTRNQEAEGHRYQELQDPDPAPYCQLAPTA